MTIDTAKLKAAAQGALQPHERLGALPTNDIFDISLAEGTQLDADITAVNAFHDESTPAKILELIAALEAKDAQIAELLEKQRLIDICLGQGLEYRIAAERRAEAAEKRVAELERQAIQPLPIGELINRLEEQTGEPWGEVYLAGINLRRGESNHG
ncbi:TPA: ead/Ea22-like family protein [Cronobacter sakazakii]|nr:ead/Ea22-like family protein [Cronobacter sakazakii]